MRLPLAGKVGHGFWAWLPKLNHQLLAAAAPPAPAPGPDADAAPDPAAMANRYFAGDAKPHIKLSTIYHLLMLSSYVHRGADLAKWFWLPLVFITAPPWHTRCPTSLPSALSALAACSRPKLEPKLLTPLCLPRHALAACIHM